MILFPSAGESPAGAVGTRRGVVMPAASGRLTPSARVIESPASVSAPGTGVAIHRCRGG